MKRPSSALDIYTVAHRVLRWDVPDKPHCSNCSHCRVTGPPEEPMVHCAKGHGKRMELFVLIRDPRPRQFVPAEKCPDWDSMGPGS